MMTFALKVGTVLSAIGLSIGSLLGIQSSDQTLGATVPRAVALFQTSLASSILSSDTSMTLVSATDKDGNNLSGVYGFIIDEGTASEEFVTATCSSTSCTGLTRGISVTTGTTTVSALQKAHRRGASVKITDAPLLVIVSNILRGADTLPAKLSYATAPTTIATTSGDIPSATWVDSQFVDASTAETINGSKTFTASTTFNGLANIGAALSVGTTLNVGGTTTLAAGRVTGLASPYQSSDAATKGYADALAIAGAPDASVTVKGIVEEATDAEVTANTAAGGTSARLFINPSSIPAMAASFFTVYSSSTVAAGEGSGDAATYDISVDASDRVTAWGQMATTDGNCGPSSNIKGTLSIKQSTYAASTTLWVIEAGDSSAGTNCGVSLFGTFVATTTETVNFYLDDQSTNDVADKVQLYVERHKL